MPTPNGKSHCYHHLMAWFIVDRGDMDGMQLTHWRCECSDPCDEHTVEKIADLTAEVRSNTALVAMEGK